MRKAFFTICIWLLVVVSGVSQSDFEKITSTMNDFMKGTSHNMSDLVLSTFYEDAALYLTVRDGSLKTFTPQEYAGFFDKGKAEYGKFNGRVGDVLGIEIENNLATATADAIIKPFRYVDKYLLRRFEDGKWRIISKASTRYPLAAE